MPVWRLQTSWAVSTAFPRDRMVITPHFNDAGATTDPESLCTDLADALEGWAGATGELRVTAYDAQGTPPVFPQGEALRRVGTFRPAIQPREIALCLSFYSQRNLPRNRGRLYIPVVLPGGALGQRPSTEQMDFIGALAPIFEGLGGADVDWCVYSRRDNVARPVTNWWVDNEWDVIRSRGLRGDTRILGSTSEA